MANLPALDVYSTAHSFQEDETRGKTVVVIDVLRASTTILTALDNGARGVIPVQDMGTASGIAAKLDSSTYLLCGERDGRKIDGYDKGNSPFEFDTPTVEGKTVILTTTNGTKAITRAAEAEAVHIACFRNARAVAELIAAQDREIMIVCAGWKNRLSMEDTLCAGLLVELLHQGNLPADASDGAVAAAGLYRTYGNDLLQVVAASNHAQRLVALGNATDIPYCCEVNVSTRVPSLHDGIIR